MLSVIPQLSRACLLGGMKMIFSLTLSSLQNEVLDTDSVFAAETEIFKTTEIIINFHSIHYVETYLAFLNNVMIFAGMLNNHLKPSN
jgi:hypothetical protein